MTLRERLFGGDETDSSSDSPTPPSHERRVPLSALRDQQLDRIESKLDRLLEELDADQESDAETAANALADEIRRQYPNHD